MAEDSKTYIFNPESAAKGGNDLSTLLALMNNNGGFGGNNWLWIIFLFFLYPIMGRGWGGLGNGNGDLGSLANSLNNEYGRDVLLQAINGNNNAISQLATTLNSDVNAIRTALGSVQNSITSVGNTVGMSGQQVINAIQMGNCQLGNQLAQCCCESKTLLQAQGYENRLATAEQTATLAGKIDAQTVAMNDQFCALKERELQSKIDSLLEANSSLKAQISNAQQTAQIQSYVGSLVQPLSAELASIKASLPSTTVVPYSPVTAIPTALMYQYGYGNANNGSIWA